jgi:hypothetical protein
MGRKSEERTEDEGDEMRKRRAIEEPHACLQAEHVKWFRTVWGPLQVDIW